ncbi:winged helix-turn-helix domain-containing protein [Lysinibacillus sp. JNUCC 51]|uniref:winged helix-turn-helix domain-containing protein n=1 Tax=Lysinibacillus sp. JNUCC-51 TaxID=2792479 RepID=UPI0019377216|nr:ArsR family transcriptional regulator [Lysinibacillus sp. JNUCC-51]
MNSNKSNIGKILFNPKKSSILNIVNKQPKTVKEIAHSLGESPSRLYYHIKQLEDAGLLNVAKEEMVGNISQKYYITSEVFEREFTFDGQLANQNKDLIIGNLCAYTNEAIRRVEIDLESEKLEKDSEISVVSLRLTKEAWRKLNNKIRDIITTFGEENGDLGEEQLYKYILMSYKEE